jgi:hypothetical protein
MRRAHICRIIPGFDGLFADFLPEALNAALSRFEVRSLFGRIAQFPLGGCGKAAHFQW